MKICDLTQAWTPTSGGIRTYLEAKRSWLAGHEGGRHEHVLVVPGARDSVRRSHGAVTYTVAAPLVPGAHPYRLILRRGALADILAAEQPDSVEFASPVVLARAAFRYRRRAAGRPRVVGFYHTDLPVAYAPAVLRPVAEAWISRVYRQCDATVAASPALAARLNSMGVPRVAGVPLGVDAALFHPGRRDFALRSELGVGADEVVLVYAGRFDSEKRPDLVLEAFARLPAGCRAALWLVGEGPLRAQLVARAAGLARAHVLPYESDRARLARLLASADIYVSAAPHETFGLSVLEAQSCGLPVVGVRAGAMIERVTEALGRLGAPGSVADLAANLDYVINNGRIEAGLCARAMVERDFGWDATFRCLMGVYEGTL